MHIVRKFLVFGIAMVVLSLSFATTAFASDDDGDGGIQRTGLWQSIKEKAEEAAESVREQGPEWYESAKDKAGELVQAGKEKGSELIDAAGEKIPELVDQAKDGLEEAGQQFADWNQQQQQESWDRFDQQTGNAPPTSNNPGQASPGKDGSSQDDPGQDDTSKSSIPSPEPQVPPATSGTDNPPAKSEVLAPAEPELAVPPSVETPPETKSEVAPPTGSQPAVETEPSAVRGSDLILFLITVAGIAVLSSGLTIAAFRRISRSRQDEDHHSTERHKHHR